MSQHMRCWYLSQGLETRSGHFLPFSRGRISAPFPIENSNPFPNTMSVFPIKKSKKKTMTHVGMIL